jgi:hypothetical protein
LDAPDEGEVEGAGSLEHHHGRWRRSEEMMTLDALCDAVPPEMVLTITKKEATKEA